MAVEARRTQDMMAVSRHLSKMDRRPASEVPPGILRARSEASSLAGSADGGSDSGTGSSARSVALSWLEQQQRQDRETTWDSDGDGSV